MLTTPFGAPPLPWRPHVDVMMQFHARGSRGGACHASSEWFTTPPPCLCAASHNDAGSSARHTMQYLHGFECAADSMDPLPASPCNRATRVRPPAGNAARRLHAAYACCFARPAGWRCAIAPALPTLTEYGQDAAALLVP